MEGHTRARGFSKTNAGWFWPWHVPVLSVSPRSPAAMGWLWHCVGFFWFLGFLEGVVDEMEQSCIAGLPLLAAVRTISPTLSVFMASCEMHVFRGDGMGATCTHVSLGSELCVALYFERWSSSSPSLSFPFVPLFSWLLQTTSGKLGFVSEASSGEAADWSPSSWVCFFLLSSPPVRRHLIGTGEGVGESVSVQLSLRF